VTVSRDQQAQNYILIFISADGDSPDTVESNVASPDISTKDRERSRQQLKRQSAEISKLKNYILIFISADGDSPDTVESKVASPDISTKDRERIRQQLK
jgi:hypothetical protein